MKTLFGLWPWRTQASSSGKNSDYPSLMNNGYESTCDKQEQLKHKIQANWFQSADSQGETLKVQLSTKSRIMPALLRLDSTGEISSVNHHIEKNRVDVNKYQTKPRTLGSFVNPKMSLNKNFASPVYPHNFSMSFPGQVYNSKNPPFPLSSTNSWYTNSPSLKSRTALYSLSKSKSFPTVKEFATSLDDVQPKNLNTTGQMFGNNQFFAALTSQAYKLASEEDTPKANLQHLWKSLFSQPATRLSQAAFSDSTVGQKLCDISSAVIPSSDTMTFNSLLVPSHNAAELESIDSHKSQEYQKSESLQNSNEEHASKSSSKCSRSKRDNDSLDINNPSMNIEPSNNINHCAFNHSGGNVSPSVLNAPRKVVKKGRPSSKKQRKRQRQKQKHACRSSPKDETSSLIENVSQSCLDKSSSFDIVFTSDESPNAQVCESKALRASTPVKDPSRHLERDSCVRFTLDSDSDESDIEFDGCDWLGEENLKVDLSPKDNAVFNVTSLDTIFKRTSIPSLKSILTADEGRSDSESSTPLLSPTPEKAKNGLCFNLINVSFSEDDSTQELNAICDPSLSSSPLEKCFFQLSPGLCLDRLFPSNSRSSNLAPGVVSLDQADCAQLPCRSSFITEINAKWNLNYPSAGFRSCQSVCKDQVDDPSIKVHFAAEPHLLTVHVVGTEDRYGTWQLYALDRDRFHRRIQEAKNVISPVLEQQHRAKIMERNSQLLTDSEKRELNNN
ncbi:unnamed protein product [Lymnaea stagnalis]|uniref:Protein DP71L n=1 Tax=Lymnaea stagnalis TaxID=6523 RepID=A0AAV2IP14_LYMST